MEELPMQWYMPILSTNISKKATLLILSLVSNYVIYCNIKNLNSTKMMPKDLHESDFGIAINVGEKLKLNIF